MEEMKTKLVQLYNSLGLVETKGQNTLIMADCMRFLDTLIKECSEPNEQSTTP